MFSKLRFEKSCQEGKRSEAIEYPQRPKPAKMFYEAENPECEGLLLCPEESCLAEDEKAVLEVHCERSGFHLFGIGDFTFKNVPVKVYLTNYRLIFVLQSSTTQKYSSFSICIEAVQDPHGPLTTKSCAIVEFDVNLQHGRAAAQRHPQTSKTVMEIVEDIATERLSSSPSFRACRIRCTFQRLGKAKMFLKGINLVRADGHACPTKECRFIEYEDLPLYNPIIDPPACTAPATSNLADC